MRIKRLIAICVIFFTACAGWWILGSATAIRTSDYFMRLSSQVEGLWGVPLSQKAPSLTVRIPGTKQIRNVIPSANQIYVDLALDYRRKGLIWYPTYNCSFQGTYMVTNEEPAAQKIRFHFDFPAAEGTYDDFKFTMDAEPWKGAVDVENGVDALIPLAPGESKELRISYATRGMRQWRYLPNHDAGQVRDLAMVVETDFKDVDYTNDSLSPTKTEPTDKGLRMEWKAGNMITRANIGIVVPEKLNPGPLASRITFFAPVCLVFFFVLTAGIQIMYRIEIHPMHYLFTASGLFAFHLLLAYLVGHIHIHLAFIFSAAVSLSMVTLYLRAALGKAFPWRLSLAGQFFYLVLFSYTFFIEGFTGVTIALGSVATLAILMKVTARVDWNRVFVHGERKAQKADPVTT